MNAGVRAGFIFGIVNALVGVVGTVIEIAVVSSAPARAQGESLNDYLQRIAVELLIVGAVSIILLVVNLVFYLFAGRSAGAGSGNVGAGVIGGLLTAVVSGVIGLIVGVAVDAAGLLTGFQTSISTAATPRRRRLDNCRRHRRYCHRRGHRRGRRRAGRLMGQERLRQGASADADGHAGSVPTRSDIRHRQASRTSRCGEGCRARVQSVTPRCRAPGRSPAAAHARSRSAHRGRGRGCCVSSVLSRIFQTRWRSK